MHVHHATETPSIVNDHDDGGKYASRLDTKFSSVGRKLTEDPIDIAFMDGLRAICIWMMLIIIIRNWMMLMIIIVSLRSLVHAFTLQ